MERFLRWAGLTFGLLLVANLAHAERSAIGKFKDWIVIREVLPNNTVCFAATQAVDKSPTTVQHGDVWFFVSSFKSIGYKRQQPSLNVRYNLQQEVPSKLSIGDDDWNMFNIGRTSFARDVDDPNIISALKKGENFKFEGTSSRGNLVTYHFSLDGSLDAISQAMEACWEE